LEYRLNYLLASVAESLNSDAYTHSYVQVCDYGCHPKQIQFGGKMFCLCLGSAWFRYFLILGVFVNDHHMQQYISESFLLVSTLFF